MMKDMTLQESGLTSPNDQGHGCCAIFKGLFGKPKTAPQRSPPVAVKDSTLPTTSSTNQNKLLDPEPTQLLAIGKQGVPMSKDDDPSQTSKERKSKCEVS
jgi:hypothetical protein